MCPGNDANNVCGKPIHRLQQPRTRHTWGADCVLAVERHIFRHRITPECLFKRFVEDLLPALFLFEENYPDRNIWQRLVRKAQDLLRNKVHALVDRDVIVLTTDESGVSRYVFAQNAGRHVRGRNPQALNQPVGEVTPRRNDNVRNLAGGDGAIAINGGKDANVTLNYTTNVYSRKNGHRLRDILESDVDTDSDMGAAVAMRAVPMPFNPTPASSTSGSRAEQRVAPSFLSTEVPFNHTRPPNSVSEWLRTNRPKSPARGSLISSPPTPPLSYTSWHESTHKVEPADSISVARGGHALGNNNDIDNVDDIGPQLRNLSLDQLYSALDELGETLVRLRVNVLRNANNAEDIKESINGHIKVLNSTQQEVDRRFGIEGIGLSARRMWWLEV